MHYIVLILYYMAVLPHLMALLMSGKKELILKDLQRRALYRSHINCEKPYLSFCQSMIFDKDFRTVFYFRIGGGSKLLKMIYPGIDSIELENNPNIGAGFVIIHGFGIVVNGSAVIGDNCTMLHNVTVGISHTGTPIIGDNVYIGCGASIIGGVKVGNNVKIGAGAVVVHDVPDNCTAVGNPARIITNR